MNNILDEYLIRMLNSDLEDEAIDYGTKAGSNSDVLSKLFNRRLIQISIGENAFKWTKPAAMLLRLLGSEESSKGFSCLVDAIAFTAEKPKLITSKTGILYELAASYNGLSLKEALRKMEKALDEIWRNKSRYKATARKNLSKRPLLENFIYSMAVIIRKAASTSLT